MTNDPTVTTLTRWAVLGKDDSAEECVNNAIHETIPGADRDAAMWDDRLNIQWLCVPCHRRRHAKTPVVDEGVVSHE